MLRMMGRVVAQDSLAGLWRGVVPSLSKTVPGVGLYFSSMHYKNTTIPGEALTPPVHHDRLHRQDSG